MKSNWLALSTYFFLILPREPSQPAESRLSPEGQKIVDYLLDDWKKRFHSTSIPLAMQDLGMTPNDDLRLKVGEYFRSNTGIADNLKWWGANNYILSNDEKRIAKQIMNTFRDEKRLPAASELSRIQKHGIACFKLQIHTKRRSTISTLRNFKALLPINFSKSIAAKRQPVTAKIDLRTKRSAFASISVKSGKSKCRLLIPPMALFLRWKFEHGSGEIFLVLDQENKVIDLNLRITKVQRDEEHPEAESEHPADQKPPSIEDVAEFLENEVASRAAKDNGWMQVADEKTGRPLKLKLVRIHRERLAKTAEGVYFVCADFETPEGKEYDLDFWVGEKDGKLSITDTTIHKEAGRPRYLWVETGGIWTHKPLHH